MSHVVQVVKVPQVQVVERTIEIADRWKIVEITEFTLFQTCVSFSTALVRHAAQAEIVEDVEIGVRPSTDGHRAVHGWPQGRPRMATGSSTDGHRVDCGWPEVVYGWPTRCAYRW